MEILKNNLKWLFFILFYFYLTTNVVGASINISTSGVCSGTDGSSKITELVNSLSSGDTLNFDCIVNLANTVTVSGKSNITITASNGGGFRATGVGTASNGITGGILFDVRNCTNCTVSNMFVDGGNLCTAVFGATNNTNTTFENLNIRNVSMQCGPTSQASAAFQASGNNGNIYRNITIDRDSSNFPDPSVRVMRGMWLGNWWREAIETNPTVENNTVRKTGHSGIIVQGMGNVVVRNNTAEDSGCAGLKVLVDGYYNANSTGSITGNQANRNDCHGLQLTTNYGARNITISNNTFNENTQTGIYIVNEGGNGEILRNSTISGNTIRNNKSANLSGGLYFVHGADGLNVSNNTFSNTNGSQTAGIIFGNDALISNTNIFNNTFSSHNRDGITLWSPPQNISSLNISNNTFSGNTAFAVSGSAYQSSFSGVTGSGNTFSGNGNNTSSNVNISSGTSQITNTNTQTTTQTNTQTNTQTTTNTQITQPNPTTQTSTSQTSSQPSQSSQNSGTFSAQNNAFVRSISFGSPLRNDYTGFVGFSFTVGSQPLTVSALGRFVVSGNTQSHLVKIVKASDSSLVASVSVNTGGQSLTNFAYGNLSSSVVLSANTTYYILSQETGGGDFWYDFGTTILTTTYDATANNAVYLNGSGSYTTVGIARSSYVPVDFKYTVGASSTGSNNSTTNSSTNTSTNTANSSNVTTNSSTNNQVTSTTNISNNTTQSATTQTNSSTNTSNTNNTTSSNNSQTNTSQNGTNNNNSTTSSNSTSTSSGNSQASTSNNTNNSTSQSSTSNNQSSNNTTNSSNNNLSKNNNQNSENKSSDNTSTRSSGGGGGGGGSNSKQINNTDNKSQNIKINTSSNNETFTSIKTKKSISLGSKGDDVVVLQTYLAKDSKIYPEGLITGYFGKATVKAIKRFQIRHGIAGPGVPGYGEVGPKTRAKLNELIQK